MFCFRILKSTQVPQSFLFASALFRFTRFASSTPLLTLSLSFSSLVSLSLWLSPFSLSAYTDNGNGSGRSSHSPYSFCVSVSAIALCAHIRFEPKNPQTHNNKRTLWTIFLLFRFAFLHFSQCFPLLAALWLLFSSFFAAPSSSSPFGPLPLACPPANCTIDVRYECGLQCDLIRFSLARFILHNNCTDYTELYSTICI